MRLSNIDKGEFFSHTSLHFFLATFWPIPSRFYSIAKYDKRKMNKTGCFVKVNWFSSNEMKSSFYIKTSDGWLAVEPSHKMLLNSHDKQCEFEQFDGFLVVHIRHTEEWLRRQRDRVREEKVGNKLRLWINDQKIRFLMLLLLLSLKTFMPMFFSILVHVWVEYNNHVYKFIGMYSWLRPPIFIKYSAKNS